MTRHADLKNGAFGKVVHREVDSERGIARVAGYLSDESLSRVDVVDPRDGPVVLDPEEEIAPAAVRERDQRLRDDTTIGEVGPRRLQLGATVLPAQESRSKLLQIHEANLAGRCGRESMPYPRPMLVNPRTQIEPRTQELEASVREGDAVVSMQRFEALIDTYLFLSLDDAFWESA